MKNKRTVYFWWSSSEVLCGTFVRWRRLRRGRDWLGKRPPGWWGVGAEIKCPLLDILYRRPHILAPHTHLFKTYRGACTHRGHKFNRPSLIQYHLKPSTRTKL